MDLFIASQNKTSLVKVNELCIKNYNNQNAIVSENICLGKYDSEKRCKEILKMIIAWIDIPYKLITNDYREIIGRSDEIQKIFYMPEE